MVFKKETKPPYYRWPVSNFDRCYFRRASYKRRCAVHRRQRRARAQRRRCCAPDSRAPLPGSQLCTRYMPTVHHWYVFRCTIFFVDFEIKPRQQTKPILVTYSAYSLQQISCLRNHSTKYVATSLDDASRPLPLTCRVSCSTIPVRSANDLCNSIWVWSFSLFINYAYLWVYYVVS